jgi:hypothetical protein
MRIYQIASTMMSLELIEQIKLTFALVEYPADQNITQYRFMPYLDVFRR